MRTLSLTCMLKILLFLVLDTAFKKLTDPEKREELNTEIERQRAWEEFNQHMGEDYKKMFEEMLITIQCSVCEKRHKKNLVKDRNFFKARYCTVYMRFVYHHIHNNVRL